MAGTDKASYGDAIRALRQGKFITLERRLERGGSLQARKLTSGAVQLYWRYSLGGRTSREPIGPYDPASPPKKLDPTVRGYSIAAALQRCRALAEVHAQRATTGGLRAAKDEQRRQFLARKAAEVERGARTLEALLKAYVAHLKAQGRRSHSDADSLFRLHVIQAWPELAKTAAADVMPDHVIDMQRRLIEQGKGRTANKLRSYLRAAFQCAIDVASTASIPLGFKAFAVAFNPVAHTKRDPKFDRPDKRPLTAAEMRTYWRLLRGRRGVPAAILRLHLLTGGQRIEQMLRLRWPDTDNRSITIFDTKGRPGQAARPHVLPLVDAAAAALGELPRGGMYVFSTTGGEKPISASTLSSWAREIACPAIEGFLLKRVRSGVETLLASKGVTREIRGHLQSHGLTGVQARHYDGHDYMPEKLNALKALVMELNRRAGTG